MFISYSWDSKSHQEWVLHLVNQLRIKGVNATADVFETQSKSINLYKMMVNHLRDSDYIIIVLTEEFAKKADSFQGGVGFESQLTLPFIKENDNKLITIARHQGNLNDVFPFHLEGQHVIDFSNNLTFDEKLEELLYRIYEKEIYHVEPLGEIPTFESKIPSRELNEQQDNLNKASPFHVDFSDLNLSNSKRITDRDVDLFLKESFKELINLFDALFKEVKSVNPNFDYDQDKFGDYKSIFKLYIDGSSATQVKIWYGNHIGGNTINLSYDAITSASDNSWNEMITHIINEKNQLALKMSMNIFGGNNASTPEGIVKEVWKNKISHYIK